MEELLPVYEYLVSPGFSTEMVKLFCAKIDSSKAPQFSGAREEGEDIKIHVLSTAEAFAAMDNGLIHNGMAIIALQWLALNLKRLQKMWCP